MRRAWIATAALVLVACGREAQERAARDAALKHDLFEMRRAIDHFRAEKKRGPHSLEELKTATEFLARQTPIMAARFAAGGKAKPPLPIKIPDGMDPARAAGELDRVVRALTPHIGAVLELGDESPLGVREARVVDDGPPAGVVSLDGRRPVLGCADGALELLAVHPPGRRPMSGEDYLRGLRR